MASEVSSTAPAQASDVFAHSGRVLSHIISGRFEDDRGEINLPTEIRIKIISSEPFHLLFNWAGSHWLNEWDQNGMETFSELGTLAYQSIIMIS